MSYTILYRSMFVKLSDGRFIPMVEMGDNNTYDVSWNGREKRSRSWQQWVVNKQHKTFPAYTKEEIMADVERMINSEKHRVGQPYASYENKEGCYTEQEIEKNFGYYSAIAIEGRHCNDTSAQQVRNFFLKGFEQAVSFDEDSDLKIVLHSTFWNEEPTRTERRKVSSEEELKATWDEMIKWQTDVWLDYDWDVNWLYDRHRKKAPKRENKDHKIGFVVTINNRYIEKTSSRRFFSSHYLEFAHVYPQRATAEKLQQRIQRASYTSEVRQVKKDDAGKWELAV